ncbi:MAG TPA: OmpA family protein [Gammaproteobacteria bacterium]|nr:OmpA family protein [Gammaproteobacteria bacterium]
MRKADRLLPLALVALAMFVPPAHALDKRLYLSPSYTYVHTDGRQVTQNARGWQLSLGKPLARHWNMELRAYGDHASRGAGRPDLKHLGLALDGMFLFRRRPAFSPYLLLGAADQRTRQGTVSAYNPVADAGVGFFSRFGDSGFGIRVDVRYRVDFVNHFDTPKGLTTLRDIVYNVGLVIPLGSRPRPARAAPPAQPSPPTDSDSDGVPDSEDNCPGTAAGTQVDRHGCPVDSDGDGVPDAADRCPGTPAGTPVDAHGCPRPRIIRLPGVGFRPDSDRLDASARKALDRVAQRFLKDPRMKAVVAGYTDNIGSQESNRKLSLSRARTVRAYLLSVGVSPGQLVARGFGEKDPVADNTTRAGRAENRRIELHVIRR